MVFPRQEEYTDEAKEALSRAQAWVFDMRNTQMDAEHLLIGFISIDNGMTEKNNSEKKYSLDESFKIALNFC